MIVTGFHPLVTKNGRIDEDNILVATRKGPIIKLEMYFDPNDVELSEYKGADFEGAVKKFVDTYGEADLTPAGGDMELGGVFDDKQRFYKVQFL